MGLEFRNDEIGPGARGAVPGVAEAGSSRWGLRRLDAQFAGRTLIHGGSDRR